MTLVEIISQERFSKYRMDDVEVSADNVCFVQSKGQEVFPDCAVVMWDGYFMFIEEYLLKKGDSGIIAAMDEAGTWVDDEDDYGSKDIGYVTNLERELEYLIEAKGNMGIKDSEDMEENGFFSKKTEDMVEELRLELVKLFEKKKKKGNEIVYLIDYNAPQFV